MALPQDQDKVLLTLLLRWSVEKKKKVDLQKALQTWFSRVKADCSIQEILPDGRAVIMIEPPPGLIEIHKLNGETLYTKDKKKLVTILSVMLETRQQDPQTADDGSANPTPPAASVNTRTADFEPSAVRTLTQDMPRNPFTSAAETLPQRNLEGAARKSCLLPLNHFWYMSHIYKEGIKQIERKNKIKMVAQVHVTFEAEQEDGNPHEALSEFIDLSQIYSADSGEAVIPLKFVDPDQWSDALKVIKRNKDKILLTMSSEEVIVSGPKQSQDEFSAVLNAMQKTNTPAEQHKPVYPPSLRRMNMTNKNPGLLLRNFSGDLLMKINMTIKDDLADEGLTIDKDQWKSLKSSYDNHLSVIKAKFNVDFKESSISEGKVNIKPSYKARGGNPPMESHAVRALLRLYQKMMTSSVSLPPPYRPSRLSGSEDSFTGAGVNGHSTQNKESAGQGATGDSKDDQCPICLSDFTNKKQLKCKHSFCEECLRSAVKACGPICPICKDVFGVMKGNQPDGNMTWNKSLQPLPGFPHCGHICITYNIPGGKQKGNHPNPGQYYGGATRTAYLPDNKEGNEVLQLLKKAFDQKLIFTVGASRTSGAENMVTWNDIHHKTSVFGGPENYGYPDENYLSTVKEELKAKGIQ